MRSPKRAILLHEPVGLSDAGQILGPAANLLLQLRPGLPLFSSSRANAGNPCDNWAPRSRG
jgi:hypothetical protein